MSEFDAVCFDLDGTLCVSDRDPVALLERAFERADADPFFTVADAASVDPGTLPPADSDVEFHEHPFSAAADAAGTEPSAATLTAVAHAHVDALDSTQVPFREGALAALEYARDRYDLALVTNGGEATQTAKQEALGITDHFDVTVYCDLDAGAVPKPDPAPFRAALDELDVRPAAVLKVGDSHGADVVGAHEVGMRSAWVPRRDRAPAESLADPDPAPTHRLDSMADLETVL